MLLPRIVFVMLLQLVFVIRKGVMEGKGGEGRGRKGGDHNSEGWVISK